MSTQSTIDASIAALGSKATYAGAGTTGVGWLLSSEATAMCGLLLGLAGLIVNYLFRRREDRRQQIEHESRMRRLRGLVDE